jgi:hypothetical protein
MKFHDQMTDDELCSLTSEQINDCAKLLLAKDGLPLPYSCPEKTDIKSELKAKAAGFVYEVGNYYFETEERAKEAVNALSGSVRACSKSFSRNAVK